METDGTYEARGTETDGAYEARGTRGDAPERAGNRRPPSPPSPPPVPAQAPAPAQGPSPAQAPAPPGGPAASSSAPAPEGVPAPETASAPPGVPPRPSAPPPRPSGPPTGGSEQPSRAGSAVVAWLDAPRPRAGLGIWRFRYVEPPRREPARLAPITVAGLLIPLAVGLILWSAWRRGTVPYLWIPLQTLTPAEWWHSGTTSPRDWRGAEAHVVYSGVVFLLIAYAVARLGSWGKVVHHYLDRFGPGTRAALTAAGALAALVFVWPSAFGVGWDPLPIAQPVLSLVVLVGDGYTVLTSPFLVYPLYAVITAAVVWPFARVGGWLPLFKRWRSRSPRPAGAAAPEPPASQWPELRAAGEPRAAEVLTAEVRAGRMNDVDVARVRRAWTLARGDARRRAAFVDTVVAQGAEAALHPSGGRDLSRRAAEHDLLLGQVRLGRYAPAERTPHAYQGAGAALDAGLLGTSLLAVGPSGAGKTRTLTAPLVESLTLQALTGACAVVAVGAAGAPLGPDDAYDVVIRLGDPASRHDLDLYAGATDPDEAAALLAEGLVGDVEGVETRRAATALAQLIGPYREAYGAFPGVPALRELLEGRPETLQGLLGRLPADAAPGMRRELESRIRQAGTAADVGPALADRLASLDRPVFAEFFGGGSGVRPFSLRSVGTHPLRVRVALPEGGHEETGRLLARLLLAQFQAVARADTGRRHFVCLVLDDAAGALTPGTVRGLARLRPQNAGVVLALRTLAEVPEALHGQLLAAVGCRMAYSGVTTWDGRAFAEAWGTERVETTEVAHHTVFADQPMTRALHAVRKMITGKAVTTDAVTVREVERERWSASELAHEVPAGHAVLSLTDVRGGSTPPLLVDLRG
ncbi:ATP/GTP-binding protein [Streptomyces tritici]|uniref:ATP/GTP-binding protein n=1 Tax=Streptomyces tritici TaxID=2054410 RepID=UPI003AF18264